ncbi:uncharacterized protein G2W53_036124 [Senna tora]|uniref:THUMP domain-containing protein n=1 Tax=Senna tora TaxID=362788 RepID=A0A834STE3_9FABA|nr:uncharacterized protein G2W53_036124 [Senna tora]
MTDEGGAATREREEEAVAVQKIEGEGQKSLAPWEQHSAVISLPRFDYSAPSSILQHSHCGFLVTCTIKREKSATKEVMSILEKYVELFKDGGYDGLEKPEKNSTAKRRRTCTKDSGKDCLDLEGTNAAIVNSGEGKLPEGTCLSPAKAETNNGRVSDLSLVKLTRSGLLLFTFPRDALPDTVGIVSKIIQSLESGSVSSPVWCHRIFPIQATCCLNEKELQEIVSELVKKFVADKQNQLGRPLKVQFTKHISHLCYSKNVVATIGIEETKFLKENANSLLDRNKCFAVVASAVKHVVEDSVVDLKCPELSVLVEWLPLSGLPTGSVIVAVSVLPINLVGTKPRLCIKALASNTKEGSGAQ